MSTATQPGFGKDSWQTPRNARTLRVFMALRNQEIGARVRELREQRGNPPQTVVADAIGVAERTYQTWESGEAKPGYRNLQRLAEFYEVSEEFILAGAGEGPKGEAKRETPDPFADLDGDVATRLGRIEQLLLAQRAQIAALATLVIRLEGPDALLPEGELGQILRGETPTPRTEETAQRQAARGSRASTG